MAVDRGWRYTRASGVYKFYCRQPVHGQFFSGTRVDLGVDSKKSTGSRPQSTWGSQVGSGRLHLAPSTRRSNLKKKVTSPRFFWSRLKPTLSSETSIMCSSVWHFFPDAIITDSSIFHPAIVGFETCSSSCSGRCVQEIWIAHEQVCRVAVFWCIAHYFRRR